MSTARLVRQTIVLGLGPVRYDYSVEELAKAFAETYSITVVMTVLLELLIQTKAAEFQPAEVVQHVEEVIIKDLLLAGEPKEAFQGPAMTDIVFSLYEHLRESAWPLISANSISSRWATLARVGYDSLEITVPVVELHDGS